MSIRLTDDVTWIKECFVKSDGRHQHLNLFLVNSDRGAFLIDSGPWNHRESIKREINEELGDRPLEAVVLTHADLPHSGNTPHFMEEWGTDQLWFTSSNPEMQGFKGLNIKRGRLGEKMDVVGHDIEFIPAPLVDRPHTSWMYDFTTDVLYTADAFGAYHSEGMCDLFSDEIEGGIDYESIRDFNRDTFKWLNYANPDAIHDRIMEDIEEYDPEYIAPSHGHPIPRGDIDRYMERFREALVEIEGAYEVGAV